MNEGPTFKQRKAFQKVIQGKSIAEAMRESGYSLTTSKVTTKLTKSDGWQKLMEKYMPDKTLAEVHREGLKAVRKENKIVDRDDHGKPIYDFVDVEDYPTRHKYLDTAYKLKGKYPDGETQNPNINLILASYGRSHPAQLPAKAPPAPVPPA